jgi:26 proteasome complex subunit DSS1
MSSEPSKSAETAPAAEQPKAETASNANKPSLGEDDEFEDFPVDDWPEDQTEAAAQQNGGDSSKHLWEESWDDDDTTDDFSAQLR